ncbi:MAG: hypothetical protein Q4F41_01480 [Eubacteriales bacterium]|nr:hypothetical protein [Eubacteriales bacterium]
MENEPQIINGIIALAVFAGVLCLALVLCRRRKKKKAGQLYELEKEFQELKSYDVYAGLFMRNARAFQALIGIEREYPDDAGFLRRLQTEFLSLLGTKSLTCEGFAVSLPAVSMNRQAFITRKAALEPKELEEELHTVQEGIREWENRRIFKEILEQTGTLLYRIVQETASYMDRDPAGMDEQARARDARKNIREIYRIFCNAGIYPMFYEDFRGNSARQQEFEIGSPYATVYPGLYQKQGETFCLLEECWGVRKGERA